MKTELICPECGSKHISQYRQLTGRIWCETCSFGAPNKEQHNPFVLTIKTDLERFVDLYKSFGIDCIIDKYKNITIITFVQPEDFDVIKGTASNKFLGAPNCNCKIVFDNNGKFTSQSFWG
jgi:hypothetical protein